MVLQGGPKVRKCSVGLPKRKHQRFRWFVNSDSLQVKSSLQAAFPHRVVSTATKPKHIGHKRFQQDAVDETIVDWYLMGMADVSILGGFSIFGRTGTYDALLFFFVGLCCATMNNVSFSYSAHILFLVSAAFRNGWKKSIFQLTNQHNCQWTQSMKTQVSTAMQAAHDDEKPVPPDLFQRFASFCDCSASAGMDPNQLYRGGAGI